MTPHSKRKIRSPTAVKAREAALNNTKALPPMTEEARKAAFVEQVKWIQQTPMGRYLVPENWTIPSQPEEREGGHIGARWSPSCGPFKRVSHEWLDFVYWDVRQPIDKYRLYNFQVLPHGGSPEVPFDYVQEGVKVRMLDLTGRPVRALAQDNPEAYIGGSGAVFVISYPKQRGKLRGKVDTVEVQMPAEERPNGVKRIVL